jgi:isoleucyl-tRNA synthetase
MQDIRETGRYRVIKHPAMQSVFLYLNIMINKVADRPNFPQIEEGITKFWKDNNIFQKSIDQRSDTDVYKFVDGPPFVTGSPHYGSLLPSIAKDVIPRYFTMKGKKVRRVWGWDCHGIPIEDKVNRKLHITSRKDVEKLGVDTYIAACREYVEHASSDWRWYIDKIGRWADMDNAYYTMNTPFMESVIWGFKQVYDKGLIYQGKRVSLYSTDTATPVSNFEVAMDSGNYKDIEDVSVFVKFELDAESLKKLGITDKLVYLVAWTTTPWTIPANFALAVNPDAMYALVEFEESYLILALDRLSYTTGVHHSEIGNKPFHALQVLKTWTGKELEGLSYTPVYDFFVDQKTPNDFKVYVSDDVVMDEGTGVLHIAPAFGEVDFQMGLKHKLSAIRDIDEEGNMSVGPWTGMYIRDASKVIAKDMDKKGSLLKELLYTHRLPFYRGDNPLIYMAQDAYFIDIQKIKKRMLELNEKINWVPEHIKHGRFEKTIASSPDWCISRNRYWATIMPIWKNDEGDEIVVGSIEEMMQFTDQITKKDGKYFFDGKEFDLHKDVCDKIVFTKNGKQYHRIPEVLDGWMDSGSVPFAEYHYPFENKKEFEKHISADYIIEYLGQVRAWFNVLLRLSTIIFDDTSFSNVICTGTLAGNDGRKMSKSYGNYPDPKEVLENIGGEALRLYMMGSAIMSGDDMNWSDENLREQIKNVLLPIWNTYKYLCIYATLHHWEPTKNAKASPEILDVWVREYMNNMSREYAKHLEAYNIPASVRLIQETIDTISSWYIRRSRDRFAKGDTQALQTLYDVLMQFIKTFAPQMPFITEEIYQNLSDGSKESVHLEDYPVVLKKINEKLIADMEVVRKVSSLGQNIRVMQAIKLRQPLQKVYVMIDDPALQEIIKDELNVKEVEYAKEEVAGEGLISQSAEGYFVTLDTKLSQELQNEGWVRELMREIQNLRKTKGMKMEDSIEVVVHIDNPVHAKLIETYKDTITSTIKASSLTLGDTEQADTLTLSGENISIAIQKHS